MQSRFENLTEQMSRWIASGVNDGLYMVSMDHSPSEQLTGEKMHTTVLVVSPGLEHAELANRIALQLRPRLPRLSKWSKANSSYRARFLDAFSTEFINFPHIAVLAISADESTIKAMIPALIDQFGLKADYRVIQKERVSLGPFYARDNPNPIILEISEKRAAMALFISHFVRRMHQEQYRATNQNAPSSPALVNWNFYGDKFPGPTNTDMDLMFKVLISLNNQYGSIRWGYFLQGGKTVIDLLVDNLAGALNTRSDWKGSIRMNGGLFYWEKLSLS